MTTRVTRNLLTPDLRIRIGSNTAMVYVSNESAGAVPAFSDGVAWRRTTDRTVVS